MKILITILSFTLTLNALASDDWITCQYPAGRIPDHAIASLYARPLGGGKFAFSFAIQKNSIFSRTRVWSKPKLASAKLTEKMITLQNPDFSLETHYSEERGGLFHGAATLNGKLSALMCRYTSDEFIHGYHLQYNDAETVRAIEAIIQKKLKLFY